MAITSQAITVSLNAKNQLSAELDRAKNDVKAFASGLGSYHKQIGIAATAAGASILAAAGMSIKAYVDQGDALNDMSMRTGISVESLSELSHAANMAGTDIRTIELGIKKMAKTTLDANEGMATYQRSFDRIGVSYADLQGMSPEDQFEKIAFALGGVEDASVRAATAQEIFGRAGTQLLPLLADGADGMAKVREEAHKLGIVFDQEAADKAAKMDDDMTRLTASTDGLKFALAEALLPTINTLTNKITEVTIKVREWMEEHPLLSSVLMKVAVAVGAVLAVVGPMLIILPQIVAGFRLVMTALTLLKAKMIAFGATMTTTTGIIGIAAAAVMALVLVMERFKKESGEVTTFIGLETRSLQDLQNMRAITLSQLEGMTEGTIEHADKLAALNEIEGAINQVEQDRAAIQSAALASNDEYQTSLSNLEQESANLAEATIYAKDALSQVEEEFDRATDKVADLEGKLNDAKAALDGFTQPKIEGMQEFEDQIFGIEQEIDKLKLDKLYLGPEGTDEAKKAIDDQIDALRTRRDILQLESSVTYEPQIRELQQLVDTYKGVNEEKPFEILRGELQTLGNTTIPMLESQLAAAKAELDVAEEAVKLHTDIVASLEAMNKDVQESMEQLKLDFGEATEEIVADADAAIEKWKEVYRRKKRALELSEAGLLAPVTMAQSAATTLNQLPGMGGLAEHITNNVQVYLDGEEVSGRIEQKIGAKITEQG